MADQSSALLEAVYRGDDEAVARLLSDEPTLDLFEAAAVGDAEAVERLLAAGRESAVSFTPDGFTALHLVAFFSGDLRIARLLIDAGADPEARSRNGMAVTPLGSAAARSRTAIARLLLEAGADVESVQNGGYAPLHSAAAAGDDELVDLLLRHGADPHREADDGRTPAALAAASGHPELAARLGSMRGSRE
ncbi:MAG: hypothetical protein NVSMB25_26300 [Thermoleophilaceae bacterium]